MPSTSELTHQLSPESMAVDAKIAAMLYVPLRREPEYVFARAIAAAVVTPFSLGLLPELIAWHLAGPIAACWVAAFIGYGAFLVVRWITRRTGVMTGNHMHDPYYVFERIPVVVPGSLAIALAVTLIPLLVDFPRLWHGDVAFATWIVQWSTARSTVAVFVLMCLWMVPAAVWAEYRVSTGHEPHPNAPPRSAIDPTLFL